MGQFITLHECVAILIICLLPFLLISNLIYMKNQKNQGEKFARKCSKCEQGMNEGYVVESGEEYYCSDECLHQVYTKKEWEEEMCTHENNDNYWTEFDELDKDYQIIDGELKEIIKFY